MKTDRVNFPLRMARDTSEFLTKEAEKMGVSKNAFILVLIDMYKKQHNEQQRS